MRNNSSIAGGALLLCGMGMFVVPSMSWLLSALGFPVNSLLSDEGWLWLFQSGIHTFFSYPVSLVFSVIITFGCYQYAGLRLRKLSLSALFLLFLFTLVFLFPVVIAAVHPRSPLVSLTGTLFPSPWLYGLPFVLCLESIVLLFGYCIFAHRNFNFSHIGSFMMYGITNYGVWGLVTAMTSFVCNSLLYMVGLI